MRSWFVAYHADKALLPAMRAFREFTLAEGEARLSRLTGGEAGVFADRCGEIVGR
jgi:hypothetical protein